MRGGFLKFIILGYLALYWTIWLHEVGHSYMYKKYGCKAESFLKVTVPFYLLFSTPSPVDENKTNSLTKKQVFNVCIAGVTVNMFLGIISTLTLSFVNMTSEVNLILLNFFALFNLTEVASYLIINNMFLSSDMKGVASYSKGLRIAAFIVGLIAIAIIAFLLYKAPISMFRPLAIGSILIGLIMSVARIFFELKNKKNTCNNYL